MLAQALGPDPLDSGAPWKSSITGKDIKDAGIKQRQEGLKPQRRASSHRSCLFGLELKSELIWEDWDLGREFTKTLVLKNIQSKLQKLRVRPPVSKFFTTLPPQIILLSPGTSVSIPVCFRPLHRCEYEDSIEFQGKDGSFQVCLRAIIPRHVLEMPDSVLLPHCAVQNSSQTTFLLKNVSKLQTCFQWESTAPFQLSPEQGLLKPSQECHITVVFQPQEALLYRQKVSCRFGVVGGEAESCYTVLLQGAAKYPCVQLRNTSTKDGKAQWAPELHFGSVAVGKSLQKHFDVFNPSPVTASFSLSQLSSDVPLLCSEFSCNVASAEVAPGGSLRATVTYTPTEVDRVSVEYLSLKCRGGLSETQLKLTGNCVGPKLSLSSSVVDFGCVDDDGVVAQTVELVNSSPVEAIYQWDLDCTGNSVFSIQPANGTVSPHGRTTLKTVYRPTRPIAHHRRVACLILHRDPIFLDLIGTCHSECHKPAILKPEHLVLYKLHWPHQQDPPDTLNTMQQQGVLCPTEEEAHQTPDSAGVKRTPMGEYYQFCLGHMDPLTSKSLLSPHVSVVPSELLFNHKVSPYLSSASTSSQPVSITNHTRGKLSLVWTVAQDSPFTVSPSSCDLAPLKSTSFRVIYDPKQHNTLHGAQLECFASYRSALLSPWMLRDSHHMEEQLLSPPWCVTVRVIGHSFQPGKEHFFPRCSLKPPRLVFPPLSVLSYRTAILQNCGDLPLTFCQDHSSKSLAENVSVVPSCGLIQPGNHQIFILRTLPTESGPRQGLSLHFQLNAAEHTKELTVVSAVEKLCVSLEGGGSLYFQPTAVGSRTERSHHIRNLSRLPLRFQWSIPESDQQVIFVQPDAGELHPNESSSQMWSFIPLEGKTHTLKPTLNFWPIQTPGCNKSQLTLTVVGTGSKGFIEAEKAVVDVGETLVGSYRSFEIPLVNNSPCTVSFCLSVQQKLLDEELPDDPETEPHALQLDSERGTIASHTTVLIRSTVRPHRRAQYLWTISYQMLNANGLKSSPPQAVCEVRARGVFPTLQVIDLCGGGSVSRLSKVHLWRLFSLDSLNELLLSNSTSAELTCSPSNRHSCPTVFTKAIMNFNFSASPLNSEPSTFVLVLHNPGSIPVDWAFLFPEDQQIEMEYWAETGEYSSTELYQMKVQDNHLFSVSPRSGTLLSGQQRAVHLTYSHDFPGTDQFPVVFKRSYGRDILLNFQGVTVERDRPYLHFASKRHVFTSVSIGDCAPPRQMYELHNGGAVPVRYEVDTAALSQLQENFNHPVLCCLNPEGEVQPGKTAILEWIFSPLEAKLYHMDIHIHVQDGDSTLLRFEGCGVDSPTLGSTNTFNCHDVMTSEPCVPRAPFHGQVVLLSEDSVSLGHIAVCSQTSRILFLTNMSHTDTVHYAWDQQSYPQVVQIHPEQGSLCPGESTLCVLTFTSTDHPTVYQLDCICQIIQEGALTRYHDALQRREEEKERQPDEFNSTTAYLTESQVLKEPVAGPVRKGPPLRKYKTLPPISARGCEAVGSICTKLTRAERRAQREAAKAWHHPEPPQPALLHVGVTAHSHRLLEYLPHFPDQINGYYRCLPSVKAQLAEMASLSTVSVAGQPSPTHGPERDLTMHALICLLRGILDDPDFTQSLTTLAFKPITYRPGETRPSHDCSFPSSLPGSPCPMPSHPTPESQVWLSGRVEQPNTVNSDRTAGCSRPKTQNVPQAGLVLADMVEDVLRNTLQNLMVDAVRGELDLTAHPSTVRLLPLSARRTRKTAMTIAEVQRENVRNRKEPAGM